MDPDEIMRSIGLITPRLNSLHSEAEEMLKKLGSPDVRIFGAVKGIIHSIMMHHSDLDEEELEEIDSIANSEALFSQLRCVPDAEVLQLQAEKAALQAEIDQLNRELIASNDLTTQLRDSHDKQSNEIQLLESTVKRLSLLQSTINKLAKRLNKTRAVLRITKEAKVELETERLIRSQRLSGTLARQTARYDEMVDSVKRQEANHREVLHRELWRFKHIADSLTEQLNKHRAAKKDPYQLLRQIFKVMKRGSPHLLSTAIVSFFIILLGIALWFFWNKHL